ncbi:MAG TPA: DsbA family protein [Acidimicrobiales bacterium]|nr:DsbA family protein [Acidimicrobiales bacterium]
MVPIDVYADIWCPFAHVGLRIVRERRWELGRIDVALLIHAWPLELVNGRPQDAEATAAHIRELRKQISTDLFVAFDPENFPSTTLPALALAARAYRQSDAKGEAVSFAVRDALFEEGRDVSDPAVLRDIGASHLVPAAEERDRASVLEDWHQGQLRRVKGSPHFFCGKSEVFCPSLVIGRSGEGHLLIKRNREALDAFLSGCFGD